MKQKNIHSPALSRITITDSLFNHYVSIVAKKLIPYQWNVLNDCEPETEKSYCIANFRIAAGELQGRHKGMVFSDTDLYKWLETLAYCIERGEALAYVPHADEMIDLLSRAQEPDGYLNTYYSINCPDRKWTNFTEGHELYSAGHLIEAAVAYYKATGKAKLLEIAARFADLICERFAPGGTLENACPGHQEIELALIRLSACTGEKRYADLARHFLEVRGNASEFLKKNLDEQGRDRIFPEFYDYDALYAQSHLPPTEQNTAEGHAVRAMYMYSAMADVARVYGDEDMAESCIRLWRNLTEKRMYITGGIGSSGHLERFTVDYDLPNDRMYCESCASVGLMMFGQRMAALTGEAKYYDVVERALCNTVLAGIAAEGDKYFYVNPLEVWPANCLSGTSMAHVKPLRQPWLACACCPANIARTLASVGQYIYAQDEKSVYINQFISSELITEIRGTTIALKLRSELLQAGKVNIIISEGRNQPVTLRVRIPPYMEDPVFLFNGNPITPLIESGYAVVAVSREEEQNLEIHANVKPYWAAADKNIRADAGKLALMFGPYVYCLEEVDNRENLANVYVSPQAEIVPVANSTGLPGTLPLLCFCGQRLDPGLDSGEPYGKPHFQFTPESFTAIPYGLWCNRAPGEMMVWLKAILTIPLVTESERTR